MLWLANYLLLSLSFRPSCSFSHFRLPLPTPHSHSQVTLRLPCPTLYHSKRIFPDAYSAVLLIPPPASFTEHPNIRAYERRKRATSVERGKQRYDMFTRLSPCSAARTGAFTPFSLTIFFINAVDHPVCERCHIRGLIRRYASQRRTRQWSRATAVQDASWTTPIQVRGHITSHRPSSRHTDVDRPRSWGNWNGQRNGGTAPLPRLRRATIASTTVHSLSSSSSQVLYSLICLY